MSRRLAISSPDQRLLLQGAVHPRALLPALALALFCAHLPANVFAVERATPTVLGIWGDYQPSAITRWVPVLPLSFAKDSGNAGGGSSGTGKEIKDKDKEKDKKKGQEKGQG